MLLSRRWFCASSGLLLASPALLTAADQKIITDKLDNWTKYPELKKMSAGFEFLKKTDFRKMEPGKRVDLDGDRMYATLQLNKTRPADKAKLEVHHNYADIHYLLEGQESIGSVSPDGHEVIDPYKPANDVEFRKLEPNFHRIEMKPGQFALFMPRQGHVPSLGKDTSAMIRKVVVKVKVA